MKCISNTIRICKLCWFGHVEKVGDDDWVKHVNHFEVGDKEPIGRTKDMR